MEIKKNAFVTESQLLDAGWRFVCRHGSYSKWEQGQEELYYLDSSGLVIGVYGKKIKSL
jgi:hypothetical protein